MKQPVEEALYFLQHGVIEVFCGFIMHRDGFSKNNNGKPVDLLCFIVSIRYNSFLKKAISFLQKIVPARCKKQPTTRCL
jgi:hypothetical protein